MSDGAISLFAHTPESGVDIELKEAPLELVVTSHQPQFGLQITDAQNLQITSDTPQEPIDVFVESEDVRLTVTEEELKFQLIVDTEKGAQGPQGERGPQGDPGPQGPQGNPANMFAEIVEITSPMVFSRQITLTYLPGNALGVLVDVVGGTSQRQFFDYIVSGQTLSWAGLGLEAVLSVNDVIRVSYTI